MPKRRRNKLNKTQLKKNKMDNTKENETEQNELAASNSTNNSVPESSNNIKTEVELPSETMDSSQDNLIVANNSAETTESMDSSSEVNKPDSLATSLPNQADEVEASSSLNQELLPAEQSSSDLSKPSCSNNLNVSEEVIDDKTEDDIPIVTDGPSDNDNCTSEDTKQSCSNNECPICLQSFVHPTRLPCSHILCFMCLKGIVLSSPNCPLCRVLIPYNYLTHPNLVPILSPARENSTQSNEESEKYFWFYEGKRGGWWQFEERMSDEIERRKNAGLACFDMMICGLVYVIDTTRNIQFPKNYPWRIRRIMRDLPSGVHKKGIAGIYGHH